MAVKNQLFLIFLFALIPVASFAQYDSAKALQDIIKFQDELNRQYKDSAESPLDEKKRKKFKRHDFFPVNLTYTVMAQLTVTEAMPFFKMKTSSQQLHDYRQYGIINFTINNTEFSLPVYQSQRLLGIAEYEDYLFLPFTDLTNGKQSYTAGRYIELRLPKEGNQILVDFNKAYNPYCAYSDKYSCPVVPAENNLSIEIPAGVKYTSNK